LPHRIGAAADFDVAAAGGPPGLFERCFDAVGNENEGGAALHFDRGAGVVRQDKGWRVIGWVFVPPAFPVVVGPGAAGGGEHVAAQDEGAKAIH
jgi:hypothetical protein